MILEKVLRKLKSLTVDNLKINKNVNVIDFHGSSPIKQPPESSSSLIAIEGDSQLKKPNFFDELLLKKEEFEVIKNAELVRLIQLNERKPDHHLIEKFTALFGTVEGLTEYNNYINLTQVRGREERGSRNKHVTDK